MNANKREAGREPEVHIGLSEKGQLALLVLHDLLRIQIGLRRFPLPELVRELSRAPRLRHHELEPRRLSWIVHRILGWSPVEPRCLVSSLVLFRMLNRQGTPAELVIGLPPEPNSPDAHAWIEVKGQVVGPPPGRIGHIPLARYGG